MLFIYRGRIVPTEPELRLLLGSWVAGEGPGLYWLLDAQKKHQILHWLSAEESAVENDSESRVSILLLRRALEDRRLA
jgi:hypothetical protein